MKDQKSMLLDVETTGLDLKKNHMWQIAGYVIINDEVVDTFDIKFQPKAGTEFSEGALEKTRMQPEDFQKFQSNKDGMEEFLLTLYKYIDKYDKTDKFHLCAYNARFDSDFIRAWMGDYKGVYYGSYFWSANIDIMSHAAEALQTIRHKMPNFQLATVYRTLVAIGLLEEKNLEGTHDALFDIEIEADIYNLFKFTNITNTLKKIKQLQKGK